MKDISVTRRLDVFVAYFGAIFHNMRKVPEEIRMKSLYKLSPCQEYYKSKPGRMRRAILTIKLTTHYQSIFNAFYEITNRCSYMHSILFHCQVHSTCFGCFIHSSSGVQFLTVSAATGTNHSIVLATYSQRGLGTGTNLC